MTSEAARAGRNRLVLAALFAAVALASAPSEAKRSSGHSASHSGSHSLGHPGSHAKAAGVPRDSHGKIKRSEGAKHHFRKSHPCPSTGKSSGSCPGYTIDHVTPLKRGGADSPHNMQWQTQAAARQKDKWE